MPADDAWASPSGPPPAASPEPVAPADAPGFNPDQNWGLNVPSPAEARIAAAGSARAAGPAATRPPKPPAFRAALALTYAGVALSLVEMATVLYALATEANRESGAESPLAVAGGLAIMAPVWVVPAGGVAVLAALTGQGHRVARAALICLLSAIGAVRLLAAAVGASAPAAAQLSDDGLALGNAVLAIVLGVLAALGAVLLLTPAVRRHFRTSPERPVA